MKEFVIQHSFRLLAEAFIRHKSSNYATYDMQHFETIVCGSLGKDLDVQCNRIPKSTSGYLISMFFQLLFF